jgi:hypothetical protein
MLRLILGERAAAGWSFEERSEEPVSLDDLWKHAILVALRKWFLLWNERVTGISIRGRVAIRLFVGEGEDVSIERRRVVGSRCMCLNPLHLIIQAASLPESNGKSKGKRQWLA